MNYRQINTDVLIIGSGATGLTAALNASKNEDIEVLLLDKGVVRRSGSTVGAVQMTGSGKWSSEKDNQKSFFDDTIESGRGLSDERLVKVLTKELEQRIDDLVEWGLRLDKSGDGNVMVFQTPGHRNLRGISAGKGNTGLSISKALMRKISRTSNIKTLSDTIAVQLLTSGKVITGAIVYDLEHNEFVQIKSKAVILATGGIGQLYPVTSNPVQTTGDGFALALRAGTTLVEMEQIQFYPVSLAYPESIAGFCISFYHLSKLYNNKGERFMKHYEPEMMEDVTRDKLAQAIASEVRAGRGTKHNGVWLDATEIIERVKLEYPYEYNMCLQMGFDLEKDRIEVGPAAHFIMGGVRINEDTETNIKGLFVAGETSGGLHGANRLVNNSISECIVFGGKAGEAAANYALQAEDFPFETPSTCFIQEQLKKRPTQPGKYYPYQIKESIRKLSAQYIGVLRNEEGLIKAQKELEILEGQLSEVIINDSNKALSRDILDFIEANHMILTAKAIVGSAILRRETRGAQYRLDFPETLSTIEHTFVTLEDGKLRITKSETFRSVADVKS